MPYHVIIADFSSIKIFYKLLVTVVEGDQKAHFSLVKNIVIIYFLIQFFFDSVM